MLNSPIMHSMPIGNTPEATEFAVRDKSWLPMVSAIEGFHCITQLLAHKSPVVSRIVSPYSRLTVLVNGPCPCHCLDHRVYTWQWETQTNVKLVYFNHKPVTNRHTYICMYVHTYIHTDIQAQPQTKTPPVPAEPA